MRRLFVVLSVVLVGVLLMSGVAVAGNPGGGVLPALWPMAWKDTANTARAAFAGPATANPTASIIATGTTVDYSNPVVGSDGTMYIQSCIPPGLSAHASTGALKWRVTAPAAGMAFAEGSPAIGPKSGLIYAPAVVAPRGIDLGSLAIAAYDSSGMLKWTKVFAPSDKWGRPAQLKVATDAAGNEILYCAGSYDVYAFNATAKTVKWTCPGAHSVALSPVENAVYAYRLANPYDGSTTRVVKLDRETGMLLGSCDIDSSDPRPAGWGQLSVDDGGTVFAPDMDSLYAISRDMTVKWVDTLPGGAAYWDSMPTNKNGVVYVQRASNSTTPTLQGGICALDAQTGALKWITPAEDNDNGGGVVIDNAGHLYAQTDRHYYCLNVSDGSQVWSLDGSTFTPSWFGYGNNSGVITSAGTLYFPAQTYEGGVLVRVK